MSRSVKLNLSYYFKSGQLQTAPMKSCISAGSDEQCCIYTCRLSLFSLFFSVSMLPLAAVLRDS